MACGLGVTIIHSSTPILEIDGFVRPSDALTNCMLRSWSFKPSFGGKVARIRIGPSLPGKSYQPKRHGWSIVAFALDTGVPPDNSGQEAEDGDTTGLGRTRLGRIVRAGGKQLLEKLNGARRNFPMKIFLLLLGFYTANALATILGQTGDWDVLVAGIVVAAIEGIGMLMYRRSLSESIGRLRSLVGMVNFWKAGVCLGLFVDAFKLGS